jgi:hypothetical protein
MSHGGWAPITRRTAVTVDGESLDVTDLVLLGALRGEWPAFEREVALGLELERAHSDGVATEEVRHEATSFRYAHGLISAADFRRWLDARELTVRELSDVLGRRLLRAWGWGSDGPPATDEEVIRVLPAEAFCDGVLARLAEESVDRLVSGHLVPAIPPVDEDRVAELMPSVLRLRAVVPAGPSPDDLRARLSRLLALEDAFEQLRNAVAEPGAIATRGHR